MHRTLRVAKPQQPKRQQPVTMEYSEPCVGEEELAMEELIEPGMRVEQCTELLACEDAAGR